MCSQRAPTLAADDHGHRVSCLMYETGSGSVPRDPRTMSRLVAGFNGGFQALHGEWGVFAEGTLFLPPKPWGATITALEGGRTGFGSWPPDQASLPSDVLEFRQNLTPLVEDGVLNPYHRSFWGGTAPGGPPSVKRRPFPVATIWLFAQ